MQVRGWLALMSFALALPTPACSGDYPLPATKCDEWCDATKAGICSDYYDPAACVTECELDNLDAEPCLAQFDAVVKCFVNSPNALRQRCVWDEQSHDCEAEVEALSLCVSALPENANWGG